MGWGGGGAGGLMGFSHACNQPSKKEVTYYTQNHIWHGWKLRYFTDDKLHSAMTLSCCWNSISFISFFLFRGRCEIYINIDTWQPSLVKNIYFLCVVQRFDHDERDYHYTSSWTPTQRGGSYGVPWKTTFHVPPHSAVEHFEPHGLAGCRVWPAVCSCACANTSTRPSHWPPRATMVRAQSWFLLVCDIIIALSGIKPTNTFREKLRQSDRNKGLFNMSTRRYLSLLRGLGGVLESFFTC